MILLGNAGGTIAVTPCLVIERQNGEIFVAAKRKDRRRSLERQSH